MSEFENECYREKTGGYQGGRFGGGMKWDIGVNRCKFLYIEWLRGKKKTLNEVYAYYLHIVLNGYMFSSVQSLSKY